MSTRRHLSIASIHKTRASFESSVVVPTTHVYTSRAPKNAARFRIRLCRRLAPRRTTSKAHCLRALGPITCLAPRPGWGVTELPTRLRSSAPPRCRHLCARPRAERGARRRGLHVGARRVPLGAVPRDERAAQVRVRVRARARVRVRVGVRAGRSCACAAPRTASAPRPRSVGAVSRSRAWGG